MGVFGFGFEATYHTIFLCLVSWGWGGLTGQGLNFHKSPMEEKGDDEVKPA